MMEKLAQAGARPPPFTIFTIMYKNAVYVPAEWADIQPLFHLYPQKLCGDYCFLVSVEAVRIFSVLAFLVG
jgi:hypothetical protein